MLILKTPTPYLSFLILKIFINVDICILFLGNAEARLQNIDPRARLLLHRTQSGISQQHFQLQPQLSPQQQLQQVQQVLQQQRLANPRIAEQYELLQQAQPQQQQQQQFSQQQQQLQQQRFPDPHSQNMNQRIIRTNQDLNQTVRIMGNQQISRPPLISTFVNDSQTASESSEIPDNVTAELEKLEQEGAPMGEVEAVSAILDDLTDDDDELLAEMGADFNILEYADPELDNITGGEKTNILDMNLEEVEVETKDDKQKKDTKDDEQKTVELVNHTSGTNNIESTSSSGVNNTLNVSATNVVQVMPTMPVSSQTQQVVAQQHQQQLVEQQRKQQQHAQLAQLAQQQPNESLMLQNHQNTMAIQQQMNQFVHHNATIGKPVTPGTRLVIPGTPSGTVGIVTSSNTVTVSYQSTFPVQRQHQPQHMQLQQHRMGMRVAGGVQGTSGRVVSVSHMVGPRMPLAPPPPPPPPPYPGLPPPYPGPVQVCSTLILSFLNY